MRAKKKARFKVGQVVFDKEQGEYVNYRREWYNPEYGNRHVVFNPRCGEEYDTTIRPLTKKESSR